MEVGLIGRLAWRSLWRNRRRTLITVGSIALGLAIPIFFVAFAEGVYAQLIDNVARMQAGHVTVEPRGYDQAASIDLRLTGVAALQRRIEAMDEVAYAKRLILGQAIARTGSGTVGVALTGVEPAIEVRISPLAQHLVAGTYLDAGDAAEAVVGRALATRLHVDVGKKLVLTTNDIAGNLVDELCRVKGIFESGSNEIDGHVIQVPIEFARRVFRLPPDTATEIGVVLRRPQDQARVMRRVAGLVDPHDVSVLSWQEVQPEVASYIRLDRGSNWVFQAMLIVLVLFTIFNTMLMSVLDRQREFAMLLALGTRPREIRLQVLWETVDLAILGCVLGMAIGGAAAWAMQVWGLDLRRFYHQGVTISGFAIDPVLHARLTPGILFGTAALVFVAVLVLSVVPMRHATRLRMIDWLR